MIQDAMGGGPGNSYRKGISLAQLYRMFADDAAAEAWFIEQRWPGGITCPHCGSGNVLEKSAHKTMPHRCRDCRKRFSVRIGTPLQGSQLGYRVWAMAIFLMASGVKGTSSMRLHRDLGMTQKTAWYLGHRIREAFLEDGPTRFDGAGPVEVDEAYIGGKDRNKHGKVKRRHREMGFGKVIVAAARDRESNQISAEVVGGNARFIMHPFVMNRISEGTLVVTDELASYQKLPLHLSVNHSAGQYVEGWAHTNGVESFWALFKRAYKGTYHVMSARHLQRYLDEFAGRHNMRPLDTELRMIVMFQIQPLAALVPRHLTQHTPGARCPLAPARRFDTGTAEERLQAYGGLSKSGIPLGIFLIEQHVARKTDRQQIAGVSCGDGACQQRAESSRGLFQPLSDRFRQRSGEGREPGRGIRLHAPLHDGVGIRAAVRERQKVIQHLLPGRVGIQEVRRQPAPGRRRGEQSFGHPGLRRQSRIDRGDPVRVAHHLPPFGVDQSAPGQTRQDVGAEIGVVQWGKQHQPLPVAQRGELLAYRQRRFTPGYADSRSAWIFRITALPGRDHAHPRAFHR